MSDQFRPPTDFIAGLDIEFKEMPAVLLNDDTRRHNIGLALGEMRLFAESLSRENFNMEEVRISGTPWRARTWLGVEDQRPRTDKSRPQEGPLGMEITVFRGEVVEKTRQRTRFTLHKLLSVETDLGKADWTPLSYRDATGAKLEAPEDLHVAAAIVDAAVKKPAKRQRKLIGAYFAGAA